MTASTGLTLNQYQQEAMKADRSPGTGLTFPLLGLFGEAGTVLSVVKKKQRDAASYLGYAPHVTEELGDVLWYFAILANRADIKLSDIANNLGRELANWDGVANPDIGFAAVQGATTGVKQRPDYCILTNRRFVPFAAMPASALEFLGPVARKRPDCSPPSGSQCPQRRALPATESVRASVSPTLRVVRMNSAAPTRASSERTC